MRKTGLKMHGTGGRKTLRYTKENAETEIT